MTAIQWGRGFWRPLSRWTGWWVPGFGFRLWLWARNKPSGMLKRHMTLREVFRGKEDCES